VLSSSSRCPFVLVDQATKNRPTLDPFMVEVRYGVGWLWRAKFAGAVRSSTVAVPDVLREHHMQVPLAEDQHAVGEFGSDRAYEPFGETVRPRAARRNSDGTVALSDRPTRPGPSGRPGAMQQVFECPVYYGSPRRVRGLPPDFGAWRRRPSP
jgi:hypothetical protein